VTQKTCDFLNNLKQAVSVVNTGQKIPNLNIYETITPKKLGNFLLTDLMFTVTPEPRSSNKLKMKKKTFRNFVNDFISNQSRESL